ncbi:ester cyclase [Anatilimnocola floriformis]|uniref:ester cyclase n=1 Tax=Anatilimnocola floriformis TaxID=2948575 RepID=UPI0020C241E8|nr:ester cyclase [Anatilimnocola floriformis]
MNRSPREVVQLWLDAFNRCDAEAAAALYHEDAVNLQVAAGEPTVGRAAMLAGFAYFFRAFPDNYTSPVNLFEDGEWAILEWRGGGTWQGEFAGQPGSGRSFEIQGCGFFHVIDGLIKFQRGYWDKVSWFGQLGLPLE